MTPIVSPCVTSREHIRRMFVFGVGLGFALGFGSRILDATAVDVRQTCKPPVISGDLCRAAMSVCNVNSGLLLIEPHGNSRYDFECRDGATFADITATFAEDRR